MPEISIENRDKMPYSAFVKTSADEDIVYSARNCRLSEQADLLQEFTSTRRFGTSMSAHRILELEQVPRVGLFAH